MDQKGELHASLYSGTNGLDAQAGYAVSDEVAIAGALSVSSTSLFDSDDEHKHTYGEVSLDYFIPFGKVGRLEFLGGAGFGSATSTDRYQFMEEVSQVEATGDYSKLFLQSNIGLETDWFETGLVIRLGQVNFSKFETNEQTYDDIKAVTFFEPAAFARAGTRNIKMEVQTGTVYPLQNSDDVIFEYYPGIFTFGLTFNIPTR